MTAVNVTISSDRVCMYTDSAALGLSGTLRRLVSKVRALPEIGCAISVRGELRALDALAKILPTIARDFDQLHAAAKSGRLKRALCRRRAIASGNFALLLPFDLVVTGWSCIGPRAFVYCNHGRMRASDKGTGPQAWTPFDVPWAVIMPMVPMTRGMRANPDHAMPEIMERQHWHREPSLFDRKGRRMVGGPVEKTTITEHGVEVHTVGGWPDKLGEPIGGGTAYRQAWTRMALFIAGASLASWITFVVLDVVWMLLTGTPGAR